MPKIYYKIKNGIGEWAKYDPVRNKTLELSVSPALSGRVKLGDKIFPLKNGEAAVNYLDLEDGTYLPRLYTKAGEAALEAITKRGATVVPSPTSEETLRRLLLRVYALEEEKKALATAVKDLKEKIERPLKF